MLYVLSGDNQVRVRSKLQDILATLRKKQPEAETLWVSTDDGDNNLEHLTVSQGIFFHKYIVIVERSVETNEVKMMSEAPHIFLLLDEKLDAKKKKLYEKYAKKVEVYDSKKENINVFQLTDAFIKRDRNTLWKKFCSLQTQGASVEELHGIMMWQINSIRRAINAKSAKAAGMKPFVYTKSKEALKKYSKDEVEEIAENLLNCLLLARRGDFLFEERFEEILLSI